jgi:hypothetical protein
MRTKTIRADYENLTLAGAMAAMLQNQAIFFANLDEDRKRFVRIEREMLEIKTLLLHHDEILKELRTLPAQFKDLKQQFKNMQENLPEAIRKKIGFHKN